MLILAPYTIYNGVVYHLHIFDISEDNITHFLATKETAHTYYVHGIALICGKQEQTALNNLTDQINKLQSIGYKIADIAQELSQTITSTGAPTSIYAITFPFKQLQPIP